MRMCDDLGYRHSRCISVLLHVPLRFLLIPRRTPPWKKHVIRPSLRATARSTGFPFAKLQVLIHSTRYLQNKELSGCIPGVIKFSLQKQKTHSLCHCFDRTRMLQRVSQELNTTAPDALHPMPRKWNSPAAGGMGPIASLIKYRRWTDYSGLLYRWFYLLLLEPSVCLTCPIVHSLLRMCAGHFWTAYTEMYATSKT